MEYLKDNELLQFHPDTLETIRKLRGYNSRSEINEAIDILDAWVKKQDHYVENNLDREYLERVIISCKGSLERSKVQIDKLCTYRSMPSFKIYFEDIDPKEILAELLDPSLCALTVLPNLTKDHDRIAVARINMKHFTFQIQQKLFILASLVAFYLKYYDYSNSYIVIVDATDADISSVLKNFSIPEFMKVAGGFLNGGFRIKEVHVINSSSLLEGLLKIAKMGFPAKLYNRLQVHRNYEAVHDYVPVEFLPKDYGGKEALLDNQFVKFMDVFSSEKYRKHRREMNSMGTDESKRRTDVFNEQYMGMPGTFRTLTVD